MQRPGCSQFRPEWLLQGSASKIGVRVCSELCQNRSTKGTSSFHVFLPPSSPRLHQFDAYGLQPLSTFFAFDFLQVIPMGIRYDGQRSNHCVPAVSACLDCINQQRKYLYKLIRSNCMVTTRRDEIPLRRVTMKDSRFNSFRPC